MVINDFNLSNIAVLLHESEELEENLAARTEETLSESSSFGVSDYSKAVGQNADSYHRRVEDDYKGTAMLGRLKSLMTIVVAKSL